MPKIVDHDQRRRKIAAVFQEQLAANGFAAASYARVAGAAGVSVGTIQHYFASRDALVQFVLEHLLDSREARVQALVTELEDAGRPLRHLVGEALTQLLPLDRVRRHEYVVEQQLRAAAWTDASLAALLRAGDEHLHRRVRGAVENGKTCGEVAPDTDADTAALQILATSTGLAQILASPSGQEPNRREAREATALTVLEPVLTQVFSGRCHHYD